MQVYDSVARLLADTQAAGGAISETVLRAQTADGESSPEEAYSRMRSRLEVMRQAVEQGLRPGRRSPSGLSGGDAAKLGAAAGHSLCGGILAVTMARALAVAEHNACMGKIVAAPTAGSCGILPGVILSVGEAVGASERAMVMSLFTAAGFGMVTATRASVSGAECGCQAECGSASAMAAASAVELAGGTPEMAAHAFSLAMMNELGLVCDPVAGLVEVPCIKRNASCAANALASAEMAMAGVAADIPADEIIDAMGAVGRMLPAALRETAAGGCAATPTGRAAAERLFRQPG